jgi:hypothetical protein
MILQNGSSCYNTVSENEKGKNDNMKKILCIFIAAVLACSIFAACSKPEETPSKEPIQVTTATETPSAQPSPTTEKIPTDVSPTTGLPGNTVYKPIMVQIDNESGKARPQTNIQAADVVYEALVESTATRLTALYNDAINGENAPEEFIVGPVRSSRYYHQRIQQEWDALFVHMGGPDTTPHEVTDLWGASSDHVKQRINGAGKHAVNTELFFPLYDGYSESDYAGIDLMEALAIYDYEPEQVQSFTFYPLEDYEGEPEIEKIELSFWSSPGYVSYEYQKDTDKLIRYMGGKEFEDAVTGSAVEVQNLIIQYVDGIKDAGSGEGGRKITTLEGGGEAEFIIHGKYLKGTWERQDYSDKTTYKLENGREVTLTPGNTWIEIHPSEKEVITTLADGTEQTHSAE